MLESTYELLGKLGSGGGGNVYLAEHLRLGKKVVLKADKRKLTTPREMLRREVDILKELNHPNIPRVYDFFVEGETVYTAMEYIEGESLDRPLKRGETYSQAQVIRWAIQLLRALSYLHSPIHGSPPRGFVHSDIKPANLMLRTNGDICLIDFNIALALGEEHVIGCSAGYASPEHYGLDFSTEGETRSCTETMAQDETAPFDPEHTLTMRTAAGRPSRRVIVPDIRSDIYSAGATLYHLLSGRRPSKNAKEVVSLSEKEFSPQIVQIISRAMNPNPDLRYQTADEMLDAFLHLRERDGRTRSWKRKRLAACIVFPALLSAELLAAFIGLRRMQTTESWLKLAEYSQNAASEGDLDAAVDYALSALPAKPGWMAPPYTAEAQKALAEALGVYDLADGYKEYKAIELPAVPFEIKISPSGKTAAALCSGRLLILDLEAGAVLETLEAEKSAFSEAEYLNEQVVVYAGRDGITAYDLAEKRVLWTGAPATAVSVSADGKYAAAVYRDESFASVYRTDGGTLQCTVDFEGKRQKVAANGSFANPRDNLFALNRDGSLLAVSFEDGSLQICHVKEGGRKTELLEAGSGYSHFEGGFSGTHFAFSAGAPGDSVFAAVNTERMEQTGGFSAGSAFGVQADESGIYVQEGNLLVRIDPVSGAQTPLVDTAETIRQFARSSAHTLLASEENILFYDSHAVLTESCKAKDRADFLQLAGDTALIGSMDSPVLRIMKYEDHEDAELFAYDPSEAHDEARISENGKTVMLFSYDHFQIYSINGELIRETEIPDAEEVYDQQFVRENGDSFLKVLYRDGRTAIYDAEDGTLLEEGMEERPDPELYEEFLTEKLRIESLLHETAAAYDRRTGRLVRQLERDAYLTYITETGGYIVAQYMTADGTSFGQLMDSECQTLAELPYLCDVLGETLIFDYPTGNMRKTHIYHISELIEMAGKYKA